MSSDKKIRWKVTIEQEPDGIGRAFSVQASCPSLDEAVATALFKSGSRIGTLAHIVSMYSRQVIDNLPEEFHELSGNFFTAACDLSCALEKSKEPDDGTT